MANAQYHWLITMQWTDADGDTKTRTGEGMITPGTAATRQNMIRDVIANARRNLGIGENAGAVLFLSLEPNEVKKPKGNGKKKP